MIKRKLLCFVAMCICLFLFASCDENKLYLSSKSNIYEASRGGCIELELKSGNIDISNLEFIIDGDATIDEDYKLWIDSDAEVQSTILVKAKAQDIESNEIVVNVVDLIPNSIELVANNTKIAVGGTIDFEVKSIPEYSTLNDYILTIVQGADIVELNNNSLSIKPNINESDVIGRKIVVRAVLKADNKIVSQLDIDIVEAESVDAIVLTKKNIIANKNVKETLSPIAYNGAGYKLNTNISDYTFVSSDENILSVGLNTGIITPKGHGKAIVTATYLNGIKAECEVFVMVPPESIMIDGVSTHIIENKNLHYSIDDPLRLTVKATNKVGYKSSSSNLSYKFELLNEFDEVIDSGDSVAMLTDNGIEFKTTGRVLVTIASNSSLNNVNTTNYEKSVTLTVTVNDGINIDSVQDLIDYSSDNNVGKVANIINNIYLDTDNNFGTYNNGAKYNTLNIRGDRVIYGNGYVISTEQLPLLTSNSQMDDLIEFTYIDDKIPFCVELYDLEIIGSGGIDGKYRGTLDKYLGTSLVAGNGDYINTYRRGIKIQGINYQDSISYESRANVKNLILDNVTISGFGVGLRLSHVVDGYLNDVEIYNCYSNGIESNQNIMTLNNMVFGQMGAFAIEITPDDLKDKHTELPKGTAGDNYDQTPKLTISGNISSNNYHDGSTPYMQGITSQLGMSIPNLLDGIIANMLPTNVSNEDKLNMSTVMESCLKNSQDKFNFYLLIFVNTKDINLYNKGNTESVFGEYSSDSLDGNMISASEIINNLTENKNYEGYKNYKYVLVDLYPTPLGNLGQIILVNQSYEEN